MDRAVRMPRILARCIRSLSAVTPGVRSATPAYPRAAPAAAARARRRRRDFLGGRARIGAPLRRASRALRVFATVDAEEGGWMVSSGPLEDRVAIRELVEAYNDAVMRFDAEAWAANWVDDAVWSLPGAGEVAGREKIVALWKQMMSAFSFVGFYASAGPIVVTGSAATATWWQQEMLHGKDGVKIAIHGRYEDAYSKRGGRWYFAKRVYAVLDRRELTE
jgi:uncharacterized protein (TIGR02246 family)